MRVAAIDVGTNSIHLLVADVGPDGTIQIVEKAREQVELGRGGLGSHELTPEAMARGLAALETFKAAMDGLDVEVVQAAATSAVREARNGADFCRTVREVTGIRIRTISGPDEARLIYLGVRPDLDFTSGYVLIIDIGGGSVEVLLCDSQGILASRSLPLGHIRMADVHLPDDPPGSAALSEIRDKTRDELRKVLSEIRPGVAGLLVGTSGSVRTLARMATLLRGEPEPPHSQGLVLRQSDLKKMLATFAQTERSKLSALPGMDMRRKATLPAAAAVLYQFMKTLDQNELVTSDRSLRDGLLGDWVLRHQPELSLARTVAWPRMRAVLRLVDRYEGHRAHAEHVRDLALSIFDGVADDLDLESSDRHLLEFSALLHDIGHHIAARDHNRHGQYLIQNSRMAGFTSPEVVLIGNIVRYHRGQLPKRSHATFGGLGRADQRRVEALSTLLRLADALDRSHNQPVQEVSVEKQGAELVIRARASGEAHMERWAAERRKAALQKLLGRPVTILVDEPSDASGLRPDGHDQVE